MIFGRRSTVHRPASPLGQPAQGGRIAQAAVTGGQDEVAGPAELVEYLRDLRALRPYQLGQPLGRNPDQIAGVAIG